MVLVGVRLAACGHGSSRLSAISEMQRHVQQLRKDRRQTQHPQTKGPDNLTSQLLPVITREMPDPYPAASILCEPAQSKCTWTCHKRHFARKFPGKMPDASDNTSIEHRALTGTVRTLQCGHPVEGKIYHASTLIRLVAWSF